VIGKAFRALFPLCIGKAFRALFPLYEKWLHNPSSDRWLQYAHPDVHEEASKLAVRRRDRRFCQTTHGTDFISNDIVTR
jgi:hypothetical protein